MTEKKLRSGQAANPRKRADEAVREGRGGLAEARPTAHIGRWEWDMISKLVKRSDEMDRVFGLSPDTFDGKPESVLTDDYVARPVHPKVLAEVLEKWIISAESRRE